MERNFARRLAGASAMHTGQVTRHSVACCMQSVVTQLSETSTLMQVEGVQKGHGEALFGTAYAQSEIYKWQHPQDCADKKFLVHKAQISGIGSFIHQVCCLLILRHDWFELNRTLCVWGYRGVLALT